MLHRKDILTLYLYPFLGKFDFFSKLILFLLIKFNSLELFFWSRGIKDNIGCQGEREDRMKDGGLEKEKRKDILVFITSYGHGGTESRKLHPDRKESQCCIQLMSSLLLRYYFSFFVAIQKLHGL